MFHHLSHHLHRRSRRSSDATACSSDDGPYSRRQSSAGFSERSCEGLTTDRTRDLWRCMLELQSRYGCYHSARIDVAMEAGDEAVDYMPNRFIIDILNDSVADVLPEEGWERLNQYLCHDDGVAHKENK